LTSVTVPPSLPERLESGKARRVAVPRTSHAIWQPTADRLDPLSLLQVGDATRQPELLAIRYGRMLVSPFTFFRGSAAVMAADLHGTPVSGLTVQLCGDAHLSNFGAFGTPERNLVFDVNDFDETLPGPWEWDIKRLAASFMVAGRHNRLSAADCDQLVMTVVEAYRRHLAEFARMGHLAVWYTQIDIETLVATLSGASRKRADKTLAKTRQRDHLQALSKMTTVVDGLPRIVDDPPLVMHYSDPKLGDYLVEFARLYTASLRDDRRAFLKRYRFVDFARKVVGVGSVGTRCYIMLLMGNHDDDPLFLQIKEANASVLEAYLGSSAYRHHGERVVRGQQFIQAASDIFLGWGDNLDTHFYVRQLRDMKGSFDVDEASASQLRTYAGLCGWALARAHACSGDAAGIAGYLGTSPTFDEAMVTFSRAYADQTERDYEALVAAVKAGRIAVETGR
jgi:uncharacterized protein (DUF2252 family)